MTQRASFLSDVHRREDVRKGLSDGARLKSPNPRNHSPSLKTKTRETRERIKRWYLSQIMPIPAPQIQTRKRRRTQTMNLEDGVRELLPRYVLCIHV